MLGHLYDGAKAHFRELPLSTQATMADCIQRLEKRLAPREVTAEDAMVAASFLGAGLHMSSHRSTAREMLTKYFSQFEPFDEDD